MNRELLDRFLREDGDHLRQKRTSSPRSDFFRGKTFVCGLPLDLNLLVMYDDLNTVGIVKMDSNGQVVKAWVGGNLLGSANIQAGDLLSNGKLILTLSNKSIAVVDVAQTLAQKAGADTFPLV